MSNGSVGASLAAQAAMTIAQAIKASGAIINVDPSGFMSILSKVENPLVVTATAGGFLSSVKYRYLTGYKGLTFFTKSVIPLNLPGKTELIPAKKIWIPDE